MFDKLFFDLLRVALGNQERLSKTPSDEEWQELLNMAEEQAVEGITYDVLDILSKQNQTPPIDVIGDWLGFSEEIREQNVIVDQRCREVSALFSEAGFESCILKGQGNARMYPNPKARVSGDIDIWVKGSKEDIIGFCRTKVESCSVTSLHVDFPIYDDASVEVHYLPTYSLVPRCYTKTRKFFESFRTEEIGASDSKGIPYMMSIPEKKVNLVFQMSHMMRHFFKGGIGLRQMIDYYYLLCYAEGKYNKAEVAELFKSLGMLRFDKAVMWVLKVILGMNGK